MKVRSRPTGVRRVLLGIGAVVALIVGSLAAFSGTSQAATSLPCDIYAAAGTPCVAAHSTTRALFGAYSGNLYQVKRASDGTTRNIGVVSSAGYVTGGYANAAAQNSFCSGTTCQITAIFDQSGHGNTLTIEGAGGVGGQDAGANATALPVTVGGHSVYGLYVSAGVGYRDNNTSGVAKGSSPEGEYMVTSGQHVNDRCCFDYGNTEASNYDTGDGHMDAINFGTECWFSPCAGSGPWVQGDLENGLFQSNLGHNTNSANTGRGSAFVTALLKNNGTSTFALKDGNAQSGSLSTEYNGALPSGSGYTPMHKEGGIVLGTGGDNSNGSVGSFFEGVMTAGYPTDAADNLVQANVVAAGYTMPSTSFPATGTAYRLTSVSNGKVMDAVNCGTGNGTAVDLWAALGNSCQQWKFASAGTGKYTITNVNSGIVLDSKNCGTSPGTIARLWTALGNVCQQWSVTAAGSKYVIVNVGNGMVLEAAGCGTANGTVVDQGNWSNSTCQQWTIAP